MAMLTRAIARYIRVSPRKTRKVIDLIRGAGVLKAEAILNNLEKRPSLYIKRVLHSAVNSAEKIHNAKPQELYVSSIKADAGPVLKRYRAMSMGRAGMIKHRTTHITLEIDRIVKPAGKIANRTTQVERNAEPTRKITKRRRVASGTKGSSV